MRFLSIQEVIYIHSRVIAESGGSYGIRDRCSLESSVAQPIQSFDGVDLYPTPVAKAAALAFFLASNHPFVDGNKRAAHACLAVTLRLNGRLLIASEDEQERIMLQLASGQLTHEDFTKWVQHHVSELEA